MPPSATLGTEQPNEDASIRRANVSGLQGMEEGGRIHHDAIEDARSASQVW
jgi:hypothetical protein